MPSLTQLFVLSLPLPSSINHHDDRQHASDPIIIHAVGMTTEQTEVEGIVVEEPIPQQMHVSRVDAIRLAPGAVAIIPLTFLPRYPHDEHEMPKPSNSVEGGDSAPPLNSYQKADLAHLVGEEALEGRPYFSEHRRNNLDYDENSNRKIGKLYEIHTTVVVETSRGKSTLPLSASSIRSNHYRVPERIRFHPPPGKPIGKSSTGTLLLRTVNRSADGTSTELPSYDCYDLYVYNSQTEPLKITEVQVSKPESVALFNIDRDPHLQNASRIINNWDGTDKIVNHGDTQYVTTVCPMGAENPLDWIVKPNQDGELWQIDYSKLDINLGYIQLKLGQDTLFVLLEWYLTVQHLQHEANKQSRGDKRKVAPTKREDKSKLKAKPRNLQAHLVPYVTGAKRLQVSIQNTSPVPIKVMRLSLLLDKGKTKVVKETGMEFQLQSDLQPTCDSMVELDLDEGTEYRQCKESGIIGEDSIWEDAMSFAFEINSNLTVNYLRSDEGLSEVTGRIVVTATTDTTSTYDEWLDLMKRNPHNRDKVVLEIPWKIKIVDGLMHAVMEESSSPNVHLRREVISSAGSEAVDALFFPFEHLDLRDWTYWPGVMGRMYDYDQEGMSHTVRIVAFSHMPLTISKMRVKRDSNDPRSKVCNRFAVTLMGSEAPELGGLHDIGGIKVDYDFQLYRDQFRRRDGKSEIQDVIHPTVCRLTFETEPVDTGEHVINLVVFTGKIEVSTDDPGVHVRSNGVSDFPFNPRGREHLVPASLAMGFEQAISWFESSAMGDSLLKHLRGKSMFGRWTSASSLFREYVLNLANMTEDGVDEREGFVEPIIMHAGAIAHGETLTIPLHFTNHNPVPVQVFMDVGEVEGMSVSISRETSRLRGDGNSMLDYLPHKIGRGFDRITGGAWASHSREGLKSFLMNSDFATSFFHFLPHRDAIEVSPRATTSLPLLRSLYKKRAKATFHADKYSLSVYADKMSGCEGNEKNPSNYVKISERSEGWPGPLLISGDLIISHKNAVCDPDFVPEIASYPRSANMMYLKRTPVTIPPGGVARFDVKVRAPDRNSLDKDVTPFLSTGLVISTDHGQVMPIIVTFEALLGQLKLSRSPDWIEQKRSWQKLDGFSHQYDGEVVEVPLQLFQESTSSDRPQNKSGITIAPSQELPSNANLTTWMYPLGASSVPLYLSSSFSRDVILRDIESCNPWFSVDLKEADSALNANSTGGDQGAVEIGTLHTTISCPSMQDLLETFHEIEIPDNYPMYPSFYQCAMEWLENRTLLQPYGCGTRPMPQTLQHSDYGAQDDATERALDALNHAITFSMFKYGNGKLKYDDDGQETGDGQESGDGQDSGDIWGDNKPEMNSTRLKSGAGRGSAIVDRLTLDIYAEMADAWRIISELDLHSITSNFRATVEYSYSDKEEEKRQTNDEAQSLTVSMRDVAIRTKLSMPHLVKPKDKHIYRGRNDNKDDFFSVFEFPPTAIADVVTMMVPLRNPTGVPVKVKLATVSWDDIIRDTEKAKEFNSLASDEVRKAFLDRFESVFTQTGQDAPIKSPGDSWWEGHGAFYQADDQGQLVQSRHNITIRAGGKAHVSLINPSLYAQSAFMVGCGTRCGLREEGHVGSRVETGLRKTSPIGASAAAGAALVGRARAPAEQDDMVGDNEPTLSAGGAAYADLAPAAFAIPYSAFDEIILPPYGEAEIGPILFRPPGRYGMMGCDTILDNDAIPFGEKVAETCSSTVFQSMVFLENSLTGLERLVLRGKGMWESIVFLDPIGSDSLDAYGDLELRNGHTTLVFPGSCVSSKFAGSSPHPVTKGVIVQNDGDLDVEFSRVFFVDSSNSGNKKRGKHTTSHGCSYRGFRLLECSEHEGPKFGEENTGEDDEEEEAYDITDEEANLFHGFRILAGANKTIFVEHYPDCTFQSDFVMLNLEFKRAPIRKQHEQDPPHVFLAEDGTRARRQTHSSEAFKRLNMELLVGFDMTPGELKTCIPVKSSHSDPAYVSGSRNISLWNNKTSITSSELGRLKRAISIGEALRHHLHGVVERRYLTSSFVVRMASISIALVMIALVTTLIGFRSSLSHSFKAKIQGPRARADSFERRASPEGIVYQSSWSSTFLCLARADPTSSELQTIGREQVRQIVLHRYKAMGVLLPQCIDSTGSFSREGGGQKPRSGKVGNATNKTLSEAIFQSCSASASPEGDMFSMPCGLGWKTTVARRILQTDMQPVLKLRSDSILAKRRSSLGGDNRLGDSLAAEPKEVAAQPQAKTHCDIADTIEEERGDVVSTSDSDALSISAVDSQVSTSNSQPPETLQFSRSTSTSERIGENLEEEPVEDLSTSSRHRKQDSKDVEKVEIQDTTEAPPPVNKETNNAHNRNKGRRPTTVSRDKSDVTTSTGSSSLVKSRQQRKNQISATIPEDKEKEAGTPKRLKANGGHKSRAKSKRSGEPPSSPASMKSTSSISTRTDTTSSPVVSPKGTNATRAIRPPPGLAPPPGFGGFDSSMGFDSSSSSLLAPSLSELPSAPQIYSQSMSSLLPPLDTSSSLLQPTNTDAGTALDRLYSSASPSELAHKSSSLFHTIRATDEKNLEISQRALHHEPMSSIAQMPLLAAPHISSEDARLKNAPPGTSKQSQGSDGGFDVMSFLDNLLDESGRDESESAASNAAAAPPLLADPWALGRQSRAAAYGISVEEKAGDPNRQGIVQAILAASPEQRSDASTLVEPLVAPAALASNGVSVFDDDDDNASPPQDYNSGDFYARLLGE